MAQVANLLPDLPSAESYFDFLDRWAVGTVDDLRTHMSSRALAKAFLLETVRADSVQTAHSALSARSELRPLDDGFWTIRDRSDDAPWALVDLTEPRFPILYTALESQQAVKHAASVVQSSTHTDNAWISSEMFKALWTLVRGIHQPHRYTQIVFQHEAAYEVVVDRSIGVGPSDEDDEALDEWEPRYGEPRATRIQIGERIGKMGSVLDRITPLYDPLDSVVRLRIPASKAGGHDLFHDGRFTNRSDSVIEMKNTAELVRNVYSKAIAAVESDAWSNPIERTIGAPLQIRFSEELDDLTFRRWVASLGRKNNRFRLWAEPIPLSSRHVHLYAIDGHLRHPIDIDLTPSGLYAVIPERTCGNTVHRLVTNIQQFVSPRVRVHIGDRPYSEYFHDAVRSELGLA